MAVVEIKNFTRQKTPSLPYSRIVGDILPNWEISLVFVGEKRARDLNIRFRKKNYTPNVLSYKICEKSGEVIICLKAATREAPAYYLLSTEYCLLLFIHAILHLKGRAHGVTMERSERKLMEKYSINFAGSYPTNVTKNSNRNRHRNLSGKTGGSRGVAR